MVCVFRILSFFRWLDDKLSAGLLKLHIKRPEAHLDRIIVFRVFLFFCGLRKSFFGMLSKNFRPDSEYSISHIQRKFCTKLFQFTQKSLVLNNVLRLWEDKLREPWRKMLAGSSNFFFKCPEKKIAGNFFT